MSADPQNVPKPPQIYTKWTIFDVCSLIPWGHISSDLASSCLVFGCQKIHQAEKMLALPQPFLPLA